MMYRRILLIILFSISVGNIKAQQALSIVNNTISTSNTDTGKFYHATKRKYEAARAIEFNERIVTASNFLANINSYFNIPAEFSFVETESNTDNLGMRHHFLRQYYKGIPMEGLGYRVHEKNGIVSSANGKAIRDINLDVNSILSEEQAFDLAVNYLQTKDTIFRSGKKLIVSKNFTFTPESFAVAFQFDMDVSLIERWRISIDALNGELVNKVSLVHTCFVPPPPQYDTGTGLTNYYGTQRIRVEKSDDGSSRMVGQTAHGGKIETKDFRNVSIWAWIFNNYSVYDFYSADNTFNDPYQQAAVSVQWAAEQAYEYYFNKHNRNSFDNNGATITSYVHFDTDMDNAFWTGEVLAFGDGSNNKPLVELDVVSHELTHAVTQYEADLTYSYESGALNESFSDIFAKAVEFNTFGDTATWQLARYFQNGGMRDMSDPNLKDQPDTYQGDMWQSGYEDNGGVHTNSGVQNFWFYLLCEGGSGVNDHGHSYSLKSIGMDTAVNIAYRNLTEYLISSSDYLDSRIGSLLATADLYGKNSSAYQEVDKAWDAVGVIDEPSITSLNLYDITATTVKLNGSLIPRGDTVTYHFEYGTTPEYGSATSIYTYTDKVEGMITGLQSETKYYVRLVATNENGSSLDAIENGSSDESAEFTTISLAPLVKIKSTVDVSDTSATLYGKINPNSLATSFYFEYGPTHTMGLVSSSYPLPDTTEFLYISAPITDLQARQTYYYKLVATNSFATSDTDSLSFFTALKPVISSFTPVTATIGTEVTITGQHFNAIPENNWVNFGACKGTVLSSSSTEIKVEVPAGASFGPISLVDTESGLATESAKEFVPTYTGEFGKGDLQLRAVFEDIAYRKMVVQDMDGDGRPDIVTTHSDGLTIFLNVNTGGDITNESFVRSNFPFDFHSLVDFDGNGLKDIVDYHQGKLRIYPNFSVPGYVFFGIPMDLTISFEWGTQFNDFDNDGRMDLAGLHRLPGDSTTIFTIFRNQNPKGTLSSTNFEQQYAKILPYKYYFVKLQTIGDLNNDCMPDLRDSYYENDHFSILLNKSHPDVFEFEEIIVPDSIRGSGANYVAYDLNQDGWKDIISHSTYYTAKMAIFENKGPNVSLEKPIVALDSQSVQSFQAGDINGDGKVDMLVGGDNMGEFTILINQTDAGEQLSDSSFVLFDHYGIIDGEGYSVRSDVILHDLNGDGRPEVINNPSYHSSSVIGHQLQIWQNAPNACLEDPSLIRVVDVSKTSATIVLPPNTSLDQFEIEYTLVDNIEWQKVTSTTLTNLQMGASYQIRARANCYLGFNEHNIDFTTKCVDLDSFAISDIGIKEISISAPNLREFEVQFSISGKDQWKKVASHAKQIKYLLMGTTYDLRYRGRCYTPTEFNYMQFTTLCPALSTLTIEELTFNKAVVNWTSNYAGDAILEYSTDTNTWTLIDETQILFPLIPGTEYKVRGSLACTDTNSDFFYTSFTTPCPKVSMLIHNSITPFSANITWVDESLTGSYIVKYSTNSGEVKTVVTNSTSLALDALTPGTQYTVSVAPECIGAEDFSLTIFTTICYVPFNISADAITHTAAEISWEDHYSGVPYSIDYAIEGSDVWFTRESALTKVLLEELRPGTEYEARVHINCLNVKEPYASVRFETSLYGETVFAPNPTENIITIYPSKNLIGNRFVIYDDTGKKVADGKLFDYTFDLSTFAAGIYILKIEQERVIKIIKH